MINDALAPGTAKDRILAPGKDDCVFDRDDALVVVAVEGPGLKLAASQLAFVHQLVERVAVVVPFRPDRPQAGFQFGRRHELLIPDRRHRVISIPSQATSQPDSPTMRCSTLSSSRIGFVLLI